LLARQTREVPHFSKQLELFGTIASRSPYVMKDGEAIFSASQTARAKQTVAPRT